MLPNLVLSIKSILGGGGVIDENCDKYAHFCKEYNILRTLFLRCLANIALYDQCAFLVVYNYFSTCLH